MGAQNERADWKRARKFLTNELARLEPQIADHLQRKNLTRMGDPAVSYVPGDYDAKEHTRVQGSYDQCQAELPQVEAALLTIGPKMDALRRGCPAARKGRGQPVVVCCRLDALDGDILLAVQRRSGCTRSRLLPMPAAIDRPHATPTPPGQRYYRNPWPGDGFAGQTAKSLTEL